MKGKNNIPQSKSNVDRIFSLFEQDKDEIISDTTYDLYDCVYNLGMFQKFTSNSHIFPENLSFLKSAFKSSDVKKELDDWSLHVFMVRGYVYAEKVDTTLPGLREALLNAPYRKKLMPALALAINYFEDLEMYEYCAHLHKIKVLLHEG